MKLIYRMLTSIIFITCSVIIILSILLYVFQPSFIYFPYKDIVSTPGDIGLEYHDITLTTRDNINIHGWYVPHLQPRATLLFFHGNAGNISHRLDSLKIFHDLGLSVFIIDYRGYGKSQGKPSENGTYNDAETAWNYLVNKQNIPVEDIIVFGRSLGAAVAIWTAIEYQPKALIVESAFTSIIDIGKKYYPYLPIGLIARIKYSSIDRINLIKCPALFIHSPDDDIVPYVMGRELFEKARQPKQFLKISGGHNEGFINSGQQYTNGLDEFINSIFGT